GGGIFRDYQGTFLGSFVVFFGISYSLFAELKAAIMAIEIVYYKGWRNIWLEYDSALVVNIFNGKGSVPWKLENIWRSCLLWLSSMCFKVSHIYREGNVCADKLASFGVSSKVYTWWDVTPRFIFEEFNTNRLGLPNYRCNFLVFLAPMYTYVQWEIKTCVVPLGARDPSRACASILELTLERTPLTQARNSQIACTSIRLVSLEPYSLPRARKPQRIWTSILEFSLEHYPFAQAIERLELG
ncbi:hypothetical protein Lal_00036528, partial [Lupinus albus]